MALNHLRPTTVLGASLLYVAPEAFKVYSQSLPGSEIDASTGLLEIPKESLHKMKPLFFVIDEVTYEFTPDAQLWPRVLNALLNEKADAYYSVISSLEVIKEDVCEFINGYVFMQRFYTAVS
ncbi:putative aspartic peptidase A1 [Rhizoctonia solani 123E]|uniref:Putative aspartic peptidase A1 n=1 Tax=Rhizoctonia solani 123E TaxID=1423351 RepID=A0A074SFN2_9AGAM|nr:putative aspartic peptidase A1 [Rhizoctonia solani 123E]